MTDILVVGGGIAGVSVAARLSALAQVTLLEAEPSLAYHTSGRSAAMFEENYGPEPVKALSRASAEELRQGGYLSPRGFLLLGQDEDKAVFEKDLQDLSAAPISVKEAVEQVPILKSDVIAFAAYHAGAQDIDTDKMIQDFARQLRDDGGKIVTGARVLKIGKSKNGWQVETGDTLYQASILVNAAGAWADQLAIMAGVDPLGFRPLRRSMAQIPAPGGYDVSAWPMFFGAGETWYAKPQSGKLLISPADEDLVPPQDAWADDMVLAKGIARYQEHVTEEVRRLDTSWAGLRTFAPDGVPVLGPDPNDPTFVWCAGQGGYGMQSAPAASQFCADLILGRVPSISPKATAALRPNRLR